MIRMRSTILVLLAAACQAPPGGDGWFALDVGAAAGVAFEDASGAGETVFAVGARGDRGAVLMTDGTSWRAIDTDELPPLARVFAAAPDELWVVAGYDGIAPERPGHWIWRWNGAGWSPVDTPVAITSAADVWGTGPDDVWVAAEAASAPYAVVLHRDRGAWTVHDELIDLIEPDELCDGMVGLGLTSGCTAGDEVWVSGVAGCFSHGGVSLRFDGSEWKKYNLNRFDGDYAEAMEIACSEGGAWSIGQNLDAAVIAEWRTYAWLEPVLVPLGEDRWFGGLWGGPDNGWVVGREGGTLQAWRLSGDKGTATLPASRAVSADSAVPTGGLTAVWQTPAGRVLAFGSDGTILERPEAP